MHMCVRVRLNTCAIRQGNKFILEKRVCHMGKEKRGIERRVAIQERLWG